MSQSRKGSITESVTNVVVGYAVNILANILIFPLFDIHVTIRANLAMGVIYTAISIVRSYTIRRAFNSFKRAFREGV